MATRKCYTLLVVLFSSLVLVVSLSLGQPMVVGGDKLTVGEAPWLARIGNIGEGACTGTLIAPSWVLTAGHCSVVSYIGSDVRIGTVSLDDPRPVNHVKSWVSHPTLDIGLINLESPVWDVPTLSFVGDTEPQIGSWNGSILGWGYRKPRKPDGTWDVDQSEAHIAAIDSVIECKPQYEPAICVTSQWSMTCHGDSGSPLIGLDNRIYGVAQRGTAGCPEGGTATYTSLSDKSIKDFVLTTVGGAIFANFEWPLDEVSGITLAGGWAFSSLAEVEPLVELWLDGEYAISMPCCSDRGDVSAEFPAATTFTGFAGVYNWSGLIGAGDHEAEIRVRDSLGNEKRLVKHIFVN